MLVKLGHIPALKTLAGVPQNFPLRNPSWGTVGSQSRKTNHGQCMHADPRLITELRPVRPVSLITVEEFDLLIVVTMSCAQLEKPILYNAEAMSHALHCMFPATVNGGI